MTALVALGSLSLARTLAGEAWATGTARAWLLGRHLERKAKGLLRFCLTAPSVSSR